MKKRVFNLFMVFAVSVAICIPTNAAREYEENFSDDFQNVIPDLEEDATNEYDYIVEVRAAVKNDLPITTRRRINSTICLMKRCMRYPLLI